MTENGTDADLETDVDRWLAESGFRFNPFVYLDAGADPNILAYLLGHDAFAALWGNWPALVFAPAGGGKTAQRVQVWRACWAGPDRSHPLPVVYLPALNPSGHFPTTLESHLRSIMCAGAVSILMALLLRPHWWLTLDSGTRRIVRSLLEWDLPLPLALCLTQLQEAQAITPLFRGLGYASLPAPEPSPALWLPLCSELTQIATQTLPSTPSDRLPILLDLALGPLQLSSVYLMLDSVDGFAETATDPAAALALLAPLTNQLAAWARRGLFLKGFLPEEIMPIITRGRNTSASPRTISLSWTPPRLAEVIRQRVYVATEGAFGGMDALATPGLRDVETQLVRIAALLPRETLVLIGRMLWEHCSRDQASPRLTPADLQAAADWYETHRPPTTQLAAGGA